MPTYYQDNSMYEPNGGYLPPPANMTGYADPLVIRDTDSDSSPGPIDCIKTRGINVKQNWLGEIIHIQNITTQTFEIFFLNPASSKNLKKWIEKLVEFEDVGGWKKALDLYGIIIENCRITNISAPTSEDANQDAIGRGQIDITVEQRKCGGDIESGSLAAREREVVPPCYECTKDGVGTGDYVEGVGGLDPHAKAIEACEIKFGTTTTSSPGVYSSATIVGAIQVNDVNCAGMTAPTSVYDYDGSIYPGDSDFGLTTLLTDACPFIDDIQEDFKFNYGKGNSLDFNHSVSIKLFDSCPKGVDPSCAGLGTSTTAYPPGACPPGTPGSKVPKVNEGTSALTEYGGDDGNKADGKSVCRPGQYNVDDALKLAREILDKNIPHFGIAFHPGILQEIDDPTGGHAVGAPIPHERVIPYYSETQNLITGEVSMAKRLKILKERDADLNYSADYSHSLNVDRGGIVTVTERGKIIGNKKQPIVPLDPAEVSDDAYNRSVEGMDDLLGANFSKAEARCVEFWEDHREFYKNYFEGAGSDEPDRDDKDYGLVAPAGKPHGEGASDLKVKHPIQKTRNFNEVTRECSYSVTFSTATNMFENFMANRTLTASRGRFGSITIKEKSDLTQYTPKGEDRKKYNPTDPANLVLDFADDQCPTAPCASRIVDNPIEIIFPEDYKGERYTAAAGSHPVPAGSAAAAGDLDPDTGAKARVMKFYNDTLANTIDFKAPNPQGCSDPLKLWSRTVNWSPSGRGLTYTVEFTTDKTVSCEYPDPHGIRKSEVSTNDNLPKRMHKEHPIVNNKVLVHDSKQTKLGSRTVTLSISLERIPKHNMLKDPLLPEVALKELMSRAKAEILKVFTDHDDLVVDDMHVKACKYSFNSRWKGTVTVVVDYLQKK